MSHSIPVGLSFAALALFVTAGGCLSSSSSSGSGDDAGESTSSSSGTSTSSGNTSSGTSSSSGTSTSSGSGGGSGSSGTSTSSSSGTASSSGVSGTGVPITPDPGGYVAPSTNSLGIQGAYYGYGDCWGTNGAPPGDCETKGSHPVSACSSITFPAAPDGGTASGDAGGGANPYTQTTPGTMCLTGTAAKVIGTPADYTNIFGIGIGFDFNNQGGVKAAYDAAANHVKAFSFHLTGVPSAGIRVEFPTTDTEAKGQDSYAITAMTDGDYTADLDTTAGDLHKLNLSFSPAPTGQPAFNPSNLLSIQFHVATNTTAAINVANLCVSNLQAIVQ